MGLIAPPKESKQSKAQGAEPRCHKSGKLSVAQNVAQLAPYHALMAPNQVVGCPVNRLKRLSTGREVPIRKPQVAGLIPVKAVAKLRRNAEPHS
jgi:hypothetical protein